MQRSGIDKIIVVSTGIVIDAELAMVEVLHKIAIVSFGFGHTQNFISVIPKR